MKKVIIVVSGGVAYVAEKPVGIELEIRDYDVEGTDIDHISIDELGNRHSCDSYTKDELVTQTKEK